LFINSTYAEEPYAHYCPSLPGHPADLVWQVDKNQLFVMGDNRNNSIDSRCANFGLITVDDLLGNVVAIY
jgi:hypothetical protein